MLHQPQLIFDHPSPDQAAHDAERAEYLERLREKLKDAEFRAIEGFPIGEDEDILALSDPPYYTACPNPFLPEIVERWQAEHAELRACLGLPDDSHNNGDPQSPIANLQSPIYHREPFAADVSEGKTDPIYKVHTYHTKVPQKAIMRYILHYTDPGDIILDGFCGTGLTGVAAQMCGDRRIVESLGYQVEDDGTIVNHQGQAYSRVGARWAVLVDLSPIATFIARNYNTPTRTDTFEQEVRRVLYAVEEKCGWMYETLHSDGRTRGQIDYTVWSDVFACSHCSGEIVFWNVAVDHQTGQVRDSFPCPHCYVVHTKRSVERVWETVYDPAFGQSVQRAKQVPVLIRYRVGRNHYEKRPDAADLALIRSIEEQPIPSWFPTDLMMFKGRQWGDMWRPYHGETKRPIDFFTRRNLWAIAAVKSEMASSSLRALLEQLLMDILKLVSKMRMPGAGQPPQNMYMPSLSMESNVLATYERKSKTMRKVLRLWNPGKRDFLISTQSSTSLAQIADNTVDYVFVDPPFGGNIMYSELSFIFEVWLRIFTNNQPEAIISRTQGKALPDYQHLMERCFEEFYRVLKPGRWITIEFHNSQNAVWNAIQEATLRARFVVADVRTLDKRQGTFKQQTTAGAVKQDLIISAYKPRTGFERRFLEQAGSEEGAWAFVRQHLDQLPVAVERDGTLEVVAERQGYLLYDRMVAFHIQRGFSVPLGAAEFYAGLKQRFPERDGMYFLSHQIAEYDRRRLQVSRVEQLALFVTDEKSAIQWLRRELDPTTGSGPQTYQDLQPRFLRELHQARHEKLPELSDVLTQNLLKDEHDRWYVPDPARQEDLEKLRERSLLREFQEYTQGKGRLKVFRTEAVRAGFKHAWHERAYRLIIQVAGRLPESVLQEDAGLLMYYDNALVRAEEEPEQERLL